LALFAALVEGDEGEQRYGVHNEGDEDVPRGEQEENPKGHTPKVKANVRGGSVVAVVGHDFLLV